MTNERGHMSSYERGVLILMEVIRPPPGVFCARIAGTRSLALPLTGHASLLEWLVTIMAPSVVQAALPFVHNSFSMEKVLKPLE